jgi:transposase-like protein
MKYTPTTCPKCARPIERSPAGGRPTRWCCEGCKRSGEDELTRLHSLLKILEEGRAVNRLNGMDTTVRDRVIVDLQSRFDHLAGVPAEYRSE